MNLIHRSTYISRVHLLNFEMIVDDQADSFVQF